MSNQMRLIQLSIIRHLTFVAWTGVILNEKMLFAGHDEVVNFLLRHFRQIKIDQSNNLGFTALMKAAIQGRTKSAKLLLFAGSPIIVFKMAKSLSYTTYPPFRDLLHNLLKTLFFSLVYNFRMYFILYLLLHIISC